MNLSPFAKGLIFILAVVLLVGGIIFINRILPGDAFSKEEAQHALYGFWLWRDVRALDWNSFWYDTGRQLIWPFLHSWILTVFFLIFGVGYVSARSLSLLFFVLSVLLVYVFSSRLSEKSGWKIGIVSCLLMLTSPLMIKFSSLNMLEGLGALLFLSAAYAYTISEERKITIEYILLAILIGLSIYTNYLYTYLLLPAFMVATLSRLGPIFLKAISLKRRGEEAAVNFIWWGYRKLIVTLILLALAALWFSFHFSRKVQLLMTAVFRYAGGVEIYSLWQNILYYPRVIVENLSFSPWLGAFLLISLFLPFIALRYRGLNKLFIYVWTVIILLALTIPAKAPRMIYIIIPFIFMIFSAVLIYIFDYFQEKKQKLGILLLVLLLLPIFLSAPRAAGLLFPAHAAENMVQVLDYFKTSIPRDARISINFNLQRLNPEVVQFHFRDWGGEVLTEAAEGGRYFMTVDLDGTSPYQKEILDDSLYRWNRWLREKEMRSELRLYSSKRFEEIGITARIYKKTSGM